jgi:hypothetical protein
VERGTTGLNDVPVNGRRDDMSNVVISAVGFLVVILSILGIITCLRGARSDDLQEQLKEQRKIKIAEMERRAEHRRTIG